MKHFVAETKNYKKHFVATGFVVNQDRTKMLLVHHKKLGRWAAPGGHIEPTETPEDAVLREIFEETGVRADFVDGDMVDLKTTEKAEEQLRTPYAVLYELMPDTPKEGLAHVHVDFLYILEAPDNSVITEQESEVENVHWFSRAEILDLDAFGAVKKFAKNYLLEKASAAGQRQ